MRLYSTAAIVALLLAVPAAAVEDAKVAAEVIGIVRAQMAAGVARKPVAERMVSAAADYTLFIPNFPTRIDGKAAVFDINTAFDAGGSPRWSTTCRTPRCRCTAIPRS